MSKLISVIMSTCNTKPEYLLDSVKSILNQSYRNIELIIIVDGGNDYSILKTVNDSRLRVVVHRDTCGLATRLNEAISIADGDYIARMDADDFSFSNRLAVQYEYMEKNPQVDICSTFAKDFGDSSKIRLFPFTSSDGIQSELFFKNNLIHPTIMFRASSIKKYNIRYDESFRYSQDYELWTRLMGKCCFSIIPKVCLFYRVHKKQVSSDKKAEQSQYYSDCVGRNLKMLAIYNEFNRDIAIKIGTNVIIKTPEILLKFARDCINANDEQRIFRARTFKNTVKRNIFLYMIKQNYSFNSKIKIMISCFNVDVAWFIMKKVILTGCAFMNIRKNKSEYDKLNMIK